MIAATTLSASHRPLTIPLNWKILLNNNDILRSLRFTLDLSDSQMMAIFKLADYHVSREQVCNWLKKDEDPDWQKCSDVQMANFLNGLITDKRGRREGVQVVVEKRLTNNMVLRKLKIAFDLTSEDILKIMEGVGLPLGQHELSAFFRRQDHRHFRPCKDQILRNFLKGLQLHLRPLDTSPA